MSKIAAIDAAVRWQLASDAKAATLLQVLNTHYTTDEEVERFLLGVSNRLRLDDPALQFDWSSLRAADVSPKSIFVVMNLIDQKTRPAEGQK